MLLFLKSTLFLIRDKHVGKTIYYPLPYCCSGAPACRSYLFTTLWIILFYLFLSNIKWAAGVAVLIRFS